MMGSFGVLLLYSTVNSATSNQWLTANGTTRNVTFHKKNIYGLMHWEKPPAAFDRIEVYKQGRSQNWLVTLVLTDGYQIFVGENAFGAFSQEGALKIARKVAERTGLRIETLPKVIC